MNNRKSIVLLFSANAISGFAQGVSMLAIPWYFAKQSHSDYFNTGYGILTVFILFFGLYAGTLVDKYSRKSNFLVTNILCGLLIGAIAWYGYMHSYLPDMWVMAVFGITMLNYNIHYPTLYAFGQEIAEPAYYQKLNSSIEIVGQSTSILSGGFAALLLEGSDSGVTSLFGLAIDMPFAIPKWDIWEVFMLDSATYFIATVLIANINYTPKLKPKLNESIVLRIKTGFQFLKTHPEILIFGIGSYMVFAMLLVEIHAVLPGYIERHLNENGSVFALADGIYAVGALCAGFGVSKVFKQSQTLKAIILLTIVTAGIFLWAFATRSVFVIYTVSIILGFTNAGIRVLRLTYLFNHIPNEVMGRVGSIFNLANVLIRSIFIFWFATPFFTQSNHIVWAYLIMSVTLCITAIVLAINYHKIKTSTE